MRQITMRLFLRRARTGAPHVASMAPRLSMAPWLLMALCALAVAACGSGAGPAQAGPSSASARPAAKVSLVIEVTPQPGAKAQRWTLQCEPTGGTQPQAAAACRQLLAAKRPFAPIPHGIMCPMIATGQQTASVKGTWFGTPVDTTFSRLSGCAAVRWSELGQVFGPVHDGPVH
jgi:Subtilisin inhibitor-like